ncbi:MAG: tRNA epoxyqueuosine(34) reductase QueG [Bacteroidota bacterium]
MDKKKLTLLLKKEAVRLGFNACGIAPVMRFDEEVDHLEAWLQNGMNAEMHYMANHFDKRVEPSLLVPGAKSMIMVLLNYFPGKKQEDDSAPVISKYAYGKDYHHVMKRKLKQLLNFLKEKESAAEGRFFVDSAPIMEKTWAVKAGLGWIGKNTLLLNGKIGSFVFIGEIITNLEFEYDEPQARDFCGSCTLCVDACPTNALMPPRVLDSNRCISYWTIEFKGDHLPDYLQEKFKNRVFGCDICQDVCPWNNKISSHEVDEFMDQTGLLQMKREEWYRLTENQFNEVFKNSPVKRAKYKGLVRNLDFLKKYNLDSF